MFIEFFLHLLYDYMVAVTLCQQLDKGPRQVRRQWSPWLYYRHYRLSKNLDPTSQFSKAKGKDTKDSSNLSLDDARHRHWLSVPTELPRTGVIGQVE
jgi:hypothetical protein